MSNPIKSLLPTPLSMQFISDINALVKLPLPLYKFFISCALAIKSSFITFKDEDKLTSILKRQKIHQQIRSGSINAIKLIENVAQKVLKLMKTSQLEEIENNLQNCQKYIGSVLSENTLIDQIRLNHLLQKLASFVHESLNTESRIVETKFGIVEWSLYNLKKASLSLLTQNASNLQKQNQKGEQKSTNNNLRQVNKMYVKVSFEENFSTSEVQKLIQTRFQPTNQGLTECKIQSTIEHKNDQNHEKEKKPKTLTMSLIDFRLFMEQLQKVKNLNS